MEANNTGDEDDDLVAQVHSLSGEVDGLRRAMRTRGVIEQAKGMLAQRLGCTPEQAFDHLSRLSQEHNVRLVEIATKLVDRTLSVLDHARPALGAEPTDDRAAPDPAGDPPRSAKPDLAGDKRGKAVELFAVGSNVRLARPEPDRLRTERQLATHRMRLASELHRLEQLGRSSALPELSTSRPGLRVVARYRPPGNTMDQRGAFYQAVPLPGGATMMAVGDGYGSGVDVVTAMTRLSAELRGLALAGLNPSRLLTMLNTDFAGQSAEQLLASVLVARYEPATRTVTWAQAGHPAPLLVRRGGATLPPRPAGVLLGLLPENQYASARILLDEGDALVLYTDAVINSRRTEDGDVARELVDLTGQAAPQGLSQLVAALDPADAREACVLGAQVTPAEQARIPAQTRRTRDR